MANSAKPILNGQESGTLRDRLMGELNSIASSDEAAVWAQRIIGAKNTLTAADARQIEHAFRAKLATLGGTHDLSEAASSIDKGRLGHAEPRRVRDKEHVRFVTKQPCLICGRVPSDPHHLRFAQQRALGGKVSDEFIVPLCRGHHREVHRCGEEAAWWKKAGIDPLVHARELWLKTHPLPTTAAHIDSEGATSSVAITTNQKASKHRRPIIKQERNDETKPIRAAGPQ